MWESLLEDVASSTSSQKVKSKNILFLGDEGVGKNNVVTGLQGRKVVQEDKFLGTGMEYTFLDVRDKDESEDIIQRMGCYILNGTTDSSYLLQLVLTPELIQDALLVMVVDLSRPWQIMESLEKWSNEINTHLESFSSDSTMARLREERTKQYQTFTEESTESKKDDEEQVTLDLDEGVLDTNFGIPFIVVATKSDCLDQLSQDYDYHQEHLDFIQLHIRRFCLKHGASLVYLGKGGKNKDVLYRLVLNSAYDMPLSHKANVAENDSVFVPSGWDNPTKINVLTESFQNIKAEDSYGDVIKNLSIDSNKSTQKEIVAEDEQEFLKKQQPLLGSSTSTKTSDRAISSRDREQRRAGSDTSSLPIGANTDSKVSSSSSSSSSSSTSSSSTSNSSVNMSVTSPRTSGVRSSARSERITSNGGASRSTSSPRRAPQGAEGQDVLKDFFNSLLQKREGDKGAKKTTDGK